MSLDSRLQNCRSLHVYRHFVSRQAEAKCSHFVLPRPRHRYHIGPKKMSSQKGLTLVLLFSTKELMEACFRSIRQPKKRVPVELAAGVGYSEDLAQKSFQTL